MSFFGYASLRMILESETDSDSPLSEELMSQLRENIEVLFLLLFYTGTSGTLTSDPPNDTTGVATDTGNFSTDEHNGRTLLMTTGLAIGNLYTIDDTTTNTLICTGDNLYADGVRSGDYYIVLYDVKASTVGHNHNGTNSNFVTLPAGSIMLPCTMSEAATVLTYTPSAGNTWEDTTDESQNYRIYIPPGYTYIYAATRIKYSIGGSNYGRVRFRIGTTYSNYCQSNSTTYAWFTDCIMDISSLSGWQDIVWQMYSEDTSPPRAPSLQGFSMYVG